MESNTTQKFVAVINGARIMSILAVSKADAIAEVVDQLNRPGRYDVYRQWVATGMQFETEVKVVGIVDLLNDLNVWGLPYEEQGKLVMAWAAKNDALYYARPRESFFESEAVNLARKAGKSVVIVEDLS